MSPASLLDPIAALGGPGRPSGDPGAVRAAAQRLAGAADELDRLSTRTGTVIGQARSAWSGMASDAFATTGGQLRTGAATDADTLRAAAGALAAYAARLEAAQSAWNSASARAESTVALNPATTPEDLRTFATQATEATNDAQAAATQLAAELDALTPAGLDPATSLALGRTLGLAAGGPDRSILGFIPKKYRDGLKYGFFDPLGIFSGMRAIEAGFAFRTALRQVNAAQALYERLVLDFYARNGSKSIGAFRIRQTWLDDLAGWLPPERAALAARLVEEGHGSREFFLKNAANIGDAATSMRGVRVVGDWLGPLGMVFDADTVISGSNLPGWRGPTDRAIAGVSFAGGVAGLASAAGLITLTPPGAIALGVIALGAGAWSLGNLIYDNRQQIAEFLVNVNETKDRAIISSVEAGGALLNVRGSELQQAGQSLNSAGHRLDAALDGIGASAASEADQLDARLQQTASRLREVSGNSPLALVSGERAAVAVEAAGAAVREAGELTSNVADLGGDAARTVSAAAGDGLQAAGKAVKALGDNVKGAGPVVNQILGIVL